MPQLTPRSSGWRWLACLVAPFWSSVGLGVKMTAIVIVGTIALVSLFTYLGTAALDENIQRTLHERVVLAQTTARHMDVILTIIENVLTESAAQDCWHDPERTNATLEHTYRRLNFFATRVFLLDNTGHTLAANPPLTATISFDQFAAVTAALSGQPFSVSRYSRPLDYTGSSTIAVVPIQDESGKVTNALLVSINLTSPQLRTFTQPIGLGETGYMDLVDLNGTILASTRRVRVGAQSDHQENLATLIRSQRQTVSACHDCHTAATADLPVREVLAFAPLERAQWGVTVRQSENEVFASIHQLQLRIFALMVVMLGGALILVYLTTRSIITPVQALTTATQRVAAGDFATPLGICGKDEIGLLARSFDTMRAHLQDSIAEIRAWNRELDARVQERTVACEQARTQVEQLYVELRRKERARRELLHRVISTQEDERKRIARELHDETCQILISMVYRLERASELCARGNLRSREIHPLLEKMLELTKTTWEGVNRIILDLRPLMLDQLGLIPALRGYAEERFNTTAIRFSIREVGEPRRLPPALEGTLFRVAQEAINNIARHSNARHTDFLFEYFDNRVTVRIRDDGQGFDAAGVMLSRDGSRGLGLMSMEERLNAVGGEFRLHTAPGHGTTINLAAPIERSEAVTASATQVHPNE